MAALGILKNTVGMDVFDIILGSVHSRFGHFRICHYPGIVVLGLVILVRKANNKHISDSPSHGLFLTCKGENIFH
jgi:hypothetical protein